MREVEILFPCGEYTKTKTNAEVSCVCYEGTVDNKYTLKHLKREQEATVVVALIR